jgi:hypothetical protein
MKTIALLLITAVLLPAARRPLVLEWEQTTAAFSNRRVLVAFHSGARIEGHWFGVTPDTFTIDLQRSHGKNAPTPGVHSFPRSSIARLRIQEKRIRGRVWGVTAGYAGGAAARLKLEDSGARDNDNVANLVMCASLIIGFTIGRLADRRTTDVEIRPAGE